MDILGVAVATTIYVAITTTCHPPHTTMFLANAITSWLTTRLLIELQYPRSFLGARLKFGVRTQKQTF